MRASLIGDLGHVVAAVAALGGGLAEHARPNRIAEQSNLFPLVVDVVLALDGVTVRLQHTGDDVAHHGPARMAEEHRPSRIGADELDLNPNATAELASPPLLAGAGDRRQLSLQPRRVEGDVDESGWRHRGAAKR